MIISASYKTDIPAFYGDWFLNRLRVGYCKMVNPYGRQVYRVSLTPQDADGFVFWTKNLGPFMDTPLKRYSTGMRARLGFSLVTSFEAEILLLDEVLSVGDWEFQRRSIERIRAMHDAGAALIAVSHSNWLLTQVCERLVDLDEGVQEWRYRHVKMVERTIGTKQGTGGSSGIKYLETTLLKPIFPDLWAIRTEL